MVNGSLSINGPIYLLLEQFIIFLHFPHSILLCFYGFFQRHFPSSSFTFIMCNIHGIIDILVQKIYVNIRFYSMLPQQLVAAICNSVKCITDQISAFEK